MEVAPEWCEGLTSAGGCRVTWKSRICSKPLLVIGSCNLLDDAPDDAPGKAPDSRADSTPDTALTKAVWILYLFSAIAAMQHRE